jgi:hypothetical protein
MQKLGRLIASLMFLGCTAPTQAATLTFSPSNTLDFGNVALGSTAEIILTATAALAPGDIMLVNTWQNPDPLTAPFSLVDEANCFADTSSTCTIDYFLALAQSAVLAPRKQCTSLSSTLHTAACSFPPPSPSPAMASQLSLSPQPSLSSRAA